jgi:hypothetical protein
MAMLRAQATQLPLGLLMPPAKAMLVAMTPAQIHLIKPNVIQSERAATEQAPAT